jgi:hypothetical protein
MKKVTFAVILCLLIIGSFIIFSHSTAKSEEKVDISIDDAKNKVKNFIEQPTAEVNFKMVKNFPIEKLYEFNTSDSTFYVNPKTGEVEYARFDKSIINSDIVRLDLNKAKDIAQKYALKKYIGFADKKMQLVDSELIDHGDAGKEYFFAWNEIINEVYTLNSVLIRINPNTGEVISYSSTHDVVKISLTPVIIKDKAIQIAKNFAKNITDQKAEAKLQIIYANGTQKLSWILDVKGNWEDGNPAWETIIINAENGEVIPY